jgi:GGDEF domain-containing protein
MLREIQRAIDNPESAPQNLLNIDIDNFKGINAAFGSEHATQLLIAVRDAVLKVFYPPHFVARVAPDLFYVIGPGELVHFESAEPIFAEPLTVDGNEYRITACYASCPWPKAEAPRKISCAPPTPACAPPRPTAPAVASATIRP